MTDKVVIRKGAYHDSAFLMRVARELRKAGKVDAAEVMMGTPMNRALLIETGFDADAIDAATPMDLIVAVRGVSEAAIDATVGLLDGLLSGEEADSSAAGDGRCATSPAFRSLAEAAAKTPDANLVSVSVPGVYAAFVAGRSLDAGRSVFLFSDNVSVEDEVALKMRARDLGLLVMGPDCGTAILNGVNLGFANRVPRGPVGIVGASGTGTQEVSCILANQGVGVSHAIGTGSRDLSLDVGGIMSEAGLRLLASDEGTSVIVLVAKHPAEAVAERMHGVLLDLGKPAVVRYLGKPGQGTRDGILYAGSLDEAAFAAIDLCSGRTPKPVDLAATAAAIAPSLRGAGGGKRLVGLFGGGSLASEAKLVLSGVGIDARTPGKPLKAGMAIEEPGHLVVDTGDDFYTVGRPHPMIDQTVRCELVATACADPSTGVVLLDLVLGDGSHSDPAPEIAAAAHQSLAGERLPPPVVVSVSGTDLDPQDTARQVRVLEQAGIVVCRTAALAAHVAAAIVSAGGAR